MNALAAGQQQRGGSAPARIPWASLERWTAAILHSSGMRDDEAALAAGILVRSDARGFKTHGLSRLKSYIDKLSSGEITLAAEPTETSVGSLLRMDAGGALGQVAGPRAIDRAIALARETPVITCQLLDAAHLGALGLHVLRAAESGMVALMAQATPPIMGAAGARRPLIGNNPLAIAAPRPNGPPVVVDMACCVAARGNVLLAARDDTPLPAGWALDAAGEPTTNANDALLGSMLPFGGYKGLALAMLVEVLAGSLSGAAFQSSLNQGGGVRSGTGHMNALVILFNPDLVCGRDAYDAHIRAWTDHFVSQGATDARIPGQRAHDDEADAKRRGVPLLASVLTELVELGAAAGLPFPDGDR